MVKLERNERSRTPVGKLSLIHIVASNIFHFPATGLLLPPFPGRRAERSDFSEDSMTPDRDSRIEERKSSRCGPEASERLLSSIYSDFDLHSLLLL